MLTESPYAKRSFSTMRHAARGHVPENTGAVSIPPHAACIPTLFPVHGHVQH